MYLFRLAVTARQTWPCTPPCAHKVLCLDAQSPHLPVLGAPFDVGYQLLLVILELDTFPIKLALCLLKRLLVLAETLGGRHALAEGPFDNLQPG